MSVEGITATVLATGLAEAAKKDEQSTQEGLDISKREMVFEPFESYSEPDLRFGVGTGLGLKIVRDIVRSYGGNVQFIDAPDNWKTCVEVTFPER